MSATREESNEANSASSIFATCFSKASASDCAGTFPKWDIAITVLLYGRRLLETAQKEAPVIRVKVPLDLHSVAAGGSVAFALATPLRVRDLVALAVREAIGTRAPLDKFHRSMRRTLTGLAAGDFTVDIDGRHFADADAVVVCEGIAHVRFFLRNARPVNIEFEV
jgi:hypothetical protein